MGGPQDHSLIKSSEPQLWVPQTRGCICLLGFQSQNAFTLREQFEGPAPQWVAEGEGEAWQRRGLMSSLCSDSQWPFGLSMSLAPGALSQAPRPRAANHQSPSLSWFCPHLCPRGVGRRCEKWDEPGQGAAALLSHKLPLCPWGLTSGLQNMRDLTRPSSVPTPGCGFPCHPPRYS